MGIGVIEPSIAPGAFIGQIGVAPTLYWQALSCGFAKGGVSKIERDGSMRFGFFNPALGDYFDRLIVTSAVALTDGSLCNTLL